MLPTMKFILRAPARQLFRFPTVRPGLQCPAFRAFALSAINGQTIAEKYAEKLKKVAEREGVKSIDDLLAQKRAAAAAAAKAAAASSKPASSPSVSPSTSSPTSHQSSAAAAPAPKRTGLPSHVRTLDKIVDLDLMSALPGTEIAKIWNTHHSQRSCLSGTMTGEFYDKFMQRARAFPMFVVPLPRQQGYEFFVLQISGHQAFFTSLLEYKTHAENARPHLVVTHYTEFKDDKDLVLMLGEITRTENASGSPVMTLLEAQNLVYQMQMFYVTGAPHKRILVDNFHTKPAELDYQALIDAVETLG